MDIQQEEIESLQIIFPELTILPPSPGSSNSISLALELPVRLDAPISLHTSSFALATDTDSGTNLGTVSSTIDNQDQNQRSDHHPVGDDNLEYTVSYLPPLSVTLTLPPTYPALTPPQATVEATVAHWLPVEVLAAVEAEVVSMWDDLGRDAVLYAYLDHLDTQCQDTLFGLLTDSPSTTGPKLPAKARLSVRSTETLLALLDYDREASRRAFDEGSFTCGICLDRKKGRDCHRMLACGDVFCRECLCDFYAALIDEGSVTKVICVNPECSRGPRGNSTTQPRAAPAPINPNELQAIGLSESMVRKYVQQRCKILLAGNKNVSYCPRPTCSGIDTETHQKQEQFVSLLFSQSSSTTTSSNNPPTQTLSTKTSANPLSDREVLERAGANRLAICHDCQFAFCRDCLASWHGPHIPCGRRLAMANATAAARRAAEDEEATRALIRLTTRPCPWCETWITKVAGCNHMTCGYCATHFCFLCGDILDPYNPYPHFRPDPEASSGGGSGSKDDGGGSEPRSACGNKLWELSQEEMERDRLAREGVETAEEKRQRQRALLRRAPHQPSEHALSDAHLAIQHEAPLVLRLSKS